MKNPIILILILIVLFLSACAQKPTNDPTKPIGVIEGSSCTLYEGPWTLNVVDKNVPPVSSDNPGDPMQVFVVISGNGSSDALPLPLVSEKLITAILTHCYGMYIPEDQNE